MKRKSLILGATLVLAAGLASCGGGGEASTSSTAPAKERILVWAADNIVDLTTTQVNAYAATYELTDKYDFVVNPMSESNAAGNMIQDVEKGADVYCFAQDQLARLVAAGALAKLPDAAATVVSGRNDAGSVSAATVDGKLYCYPLTSDNGYFMYYDKSVVSEDHVGDLEAIIADCVAANKEFHFNGSSAWYNAGFFFGAGCKSEWTTTIKGEFTEYDDTYNSANGLKAAKGLKTIITSPVYVDASDADKGFNGNAAVVISGTWDYAKASAALGDNLGCAELPSFTVGEEKIHIGSFAGYKLVGVKPSLDSDKLGVAHGLANYLSDGAAQLARFNAVGWGPSNKDAQNDDIVKSAPHLVALHKQNEHSVVQGQYPGGWWDHAGSIGSSIKTAGADATEATLQSILTAYAGGLDDLLG